MKHIINKLIEAKQDEYREQVTYFNSAIQGLDKALELVPQYFKHFSKHDGSHSREIVSHIENVLGEENIKKLSLSDQMMIMLAAYAHDIGMVLDPTEIEALFSREDLSDVLKANLDTSYDDFKGIISRILTKHGYSTPEDAFQMYKDVEIIIENTFRRGHAQKSAQIIMEHAKEQNTEDSLRELLHFRGLKHLADICAAHGKSPKEILELPAQENGMFGDHYHPRFIASLLCLGDLLDLDTDRFDDKLLSVVSEMPSLSSLHQKMNHSVISKSVDVGVIKLSIDCESIQVYRIARQWTDWLKEQITFMTMNWDEITPNEDIRAPKLKECILTINGDERLTKFADTKVKIDAAKATKLLQGSNIYSDKRVFLREIIQNAIDSSLIQLYLDCEKKLKDKASFEDVVDLIDRDRIHIHDYDIDGKIFIEDEKIKITIADHGTGISTDEISSMAALGGKSKNLKDLIGRMPEVIRPSGAFGIGLQSVFLVADSIVFYTKTENDAPKIITMEDPTISGFVYVEDCSRIMERGTEIEITINNNKILQRGSFPTVNHSLMIPGSNEYYLNWLKEGLEEQYFCVDGRMSRTINDYFKVQFKVILPNANTYEITRQSLLDKEDVHFDNLFITSESMEHPILKLTEDELLYLKFDQNNKCLFQATLPLNEIYFNPDGHYMYTDFNDGNFIKRQSVSYRNNVIKDSLMFLPAFSGVQYFGKILKYNLDILSSSSEDILTLDRTKIRNDYLQIVTNMIHDEIDIMCKFVIDEYLDIKTCQNENFVFWLHYMALSADYRVIEIVKKYADVLANIKITYLYDPFLPETEIDVPLIDLINNDFYIIESKCDKKWIPDGILDKTIQPFDYSKNMCFSMPNPFDMIVRKKRAFSLSADKLLFHLLPFEVISVIISSRNDELVYIYKVKRLNGESQSDSFEYPELHSVYIFWYALNHNNETIHMLEGYESLDVSEYAADRMSLSMGIDPPAVIPIRIQDDIRNRLVEDLINQRHIDIDSYIDSIKNSEQYKRNIDLISYYHNDISKEEIEKTYLTYLSEQFQLITKPEYRELYSIPNLH
jgi:hypothetical protein